MDIFRSLAEQRPARDEGDDDPDLAEYDTELRLEDALRGLSEGLRLVVDSYLGLTLTVRYDGFPVTFTALQASCHPAEIRTSLRLPAAALTNFRHWSALDLYAARPGAFVDLAADICHALRLPPDRVVLDHHLSPPANGSGLTGARELSHINQAVGILVSHGQTPEDARTELRRRARHQRSTVPHVALEVIKATVHGSARTSP